MRNGDEGSQLIFKCSLYFIESITIVLFSIIYLNYRGFICKNFKNIMSQNLHMNPWVLRKTVLPQHTDHAGVMWHGSYLNWLEEARINALSSVGLTYKEISQAGFEMPVVEVKIKFKRPLFHGDQVLLESAVSKGKGPRWKFETNFLNDSSKVLANSNVDLVLINKDDFTLIRKEPDFIFRALSYLIEGPQ